MTNVKIIKLEKLFFSLIIILTLSACSVSTFVLQPLEEDKSLLSLKVNGTDNPSDVVITEGSSLFFVVSQNIVQNKETEFSLFTEGNSQLIESVFNETFPIYHKILPGQTSAQMTLSTRVNAVYSGNRSFPMKLKLAQSNTIVSFNLIIKDQQEPPVISFSNSQLNVSESDNLTLVTVNMSPESLFPVSVSYDLTDGSAIKNTHYSANSGVVTFLPGQTTQTISINLIDDLISNPTRNLTLSLNSVTGEAALSSQKNLSINILDNESPTLSISGSSAAQGNSVSFTVTLNPTSFETVRVNYETENGGAQSGVHFTSTSGELTFLPGESSKTVQVPTLVLGDEVCASNRNFNLNLLNPSQASIGVSTASGIIVDNKVPVISVSPASAIEGISLSFSVSLNKPCSNKNVLFNWSTLNGTAISGVDYESTNTFITIPAGSSEAFLVVNTIDNASYQGSRNLEVILSSISNANSGTLSAQGTILDDELPMGVFNITGITSPEDLLLDSYLSNATSPTVNWESSTHATHYDVTIFQNDGLTVQCASQNTTDTFLNLGGGCSLTPGNSYKAQVIARKDSQTQNAANGLYSFYVNQSPILGSNGDGPWYVMSDQSLVLNALWEASPSVGIATDPEGDPISVTVVNNGILGSAANHSSFIQYAPSSSDMYGRDNLDIVIQDNRGGKLEATIKINVMQPYTWTGQISTSWTTPGNWCGSVSSDKKSCSGAVSLPSTTHRVYFDSTCSSLFTCTPMTTGPINIGGVRIKQNGFTQGSGQSIIVGSSGWVQSGGLFTGTSGSIQVTSLQVTGGSFVSTQDILSLGTISCGSLDIFSVVDKSYFLHNNGTVRLAKFRPVGGACTSNANVHVPSNFDFYNLETYMTTANDPGWNSFFNATNSPQFNVLNNLTLSGGIVYFNSNLKKNLIVNNLTACHNLNYDIIFSGEGEQTYGSTTPGGCSPSLVINKDSGTVSPTAGLTSFWARRIDVQKGIFNTPSSGTLKIGSIACASETVLRETVGLGQLQMNGANIYFNATRSLSGSCHNTSTINLRPSFEFGNLDLIATQSNGGWHSYLNITNPIVVNGSLNKANYRINGEIFFNGSHFTELTNQTNSTNTGTLNFSSGGAQSYLCSGCNGAQFNKINIINGSVVTLNSNLDLVTTTGDLHILDGILNLASYNLTVARQLRIGSSGVLNANGNSFTPNSGVNYIIDSGGIVNP